MEILAQALVGGFVGLAFVLIGVFAYVAFLWLVEP